MIMSEGEIRVLPQIKYTPTLRHSQAGVAYTVYKKVMPSFPRGDNRHERRKIVALGRKSPWKA